MNLKRLKNYLVITLLALVGISASAQTSASAIEGKKQTLFSSANHASTPYRIPAIATMSNGEIIAIADQRPCGADVGNGDVDIYAKISNNNGAKGSWTPENIDPSSQSDTPGRIANGGTGTSKGYGDAAVAADPSSGKVVFMCVGGGKTTYAKAETSTSDYLCIRNYSEDYGRTWKQTDVTPFFKGDNNVLGADVASMFFGSGKLAVSKKVPGRIYGALLVRQGKSKLFGSYISYEAKNYVVYSNDWGATWKLLGSGACCSDGDEPKVEELPNGDILLSSRASGARYFNVFKFTNVESATGSWGTAKSCSFAGSNSTNGEILLYQGVSLKNDQSGTKYNILLQSIPTGSSRSNVSVYYKAFVESKTSWEVSDFISGWTKGIEVDNGASAYSTMTIMPNGEIGFLYEDNYDTSKASGDYSDITFVPLTVEEITGDAYTYVADVAETIVATPVITPNGGEIEAGTTISISCATEGATIYYSTNGAEPTTVYSAPFALNNVATVKAVAKKEGWNDSEIVAASFTIKQEVVEPEEPTQPSTPAVAKFRIKNVQKDGKVFYFTYSATDGIGLTADVEQAAQYTRKTVNEANGVYAFQVEDGSYLIWSGKGEDYPGYYDGKGYVAESEYDAAKCDLTVAPMVAGGNVESFEGTYYTIMGEREGAKNFWGNAKIEDVYFVIKNDKTFSAGMDPYFNDTYSSAFVIEEIVTITEPEVKKVAAPVFTPAAGEVEESIELTITCATEGAKILISPDESWPLEQWIEYSNGMFRIGDGLTIYAIAVLEGWENSDIVKASYTVKKEIVATPVINPNGGIIESDDRISITCADPNATIYYTIDGTEPTVESPIYIREFKLESDAIVKAIAVRNGWANSAVATAEFVIKETNELVVNFEKGYMDGITRYMTTFSAPFATTVPGNVKVYIVKKITSSYTYFTRLYNNNIPAYTGVLLQATKAGEVVIPEAKAGVNMANTSGNILIGTADGEVLLDTDAYVFSKNSSKKYAFYRIDAGEVVPQYSAYYVLGNSYAKVHAIGLSFDDETGESSGIEDVNAEDAEVEYYNLQGVKVENPEKGIYIMKQGGKTSKVVL